MPLAHIESGRRRERAVRSLERACAPEPRRFNLVGALGGIIAMIGAAAILLGLCDLVIRIVQHAHLVITGLAGAPS